ncbi:MAG: putative selenium-dependent hydroxylase accessory protein YqeC [Anaerolineae bacterium]|nr:putative selenium-dependent hydroxylase accessory protein YqeC [Anaerolineae bacterium]
MQLRRALRIWPKEVVAFTGAGGKTAALFRLAGELAAAGWRVITTTTTRLGLDQLALAPRVQHISDLSRLADALAQYHQVLVIGGEDKTTQKTLGLTSEQVCALASRSDVDAALVEADGARGLSLKAPAAHEPVVPPCTTLLVPVAGLDATGQPLGPAIAHRVEQVSALTGLLPGEAISPATMAALLAHRQGGLKGLPSGARAVALLNKVETEEAQAAAAEVASRLLGEPAFAAVVAGAVRREDPVAAAWTRVAAVVLAAGASRRYGEPKQLIPWGQTTLLAHVVSQARASQVAQTVVVVGHEAERMAQALANWGDDGGVQIVYNGDWEVGLSTSVQAGLRALPASFSAALFLLADQPGVTGDLINAVLRRYWETLAPIVAPRHRGRRGNPVLFDRSLFAELMRLAGDRGGRSLIEEYAAEVAWVEAGPEALADVDTPADYDRWRRA